VFARESFTAEERARLAPFVSDLDAPVFALLNLPQSTMGAMFARYSRYPGTLRRLMLDEFAEELETPPAAGGTGGARTTALYERVLGEYGDDSVAQLGGAHIACEWSSNILTKILQRPRLGAYLEQSTRYIAYDRTMPGGGYRYYRGPELGPAYESAMDSLFETYTALQAPVVEWIAERFPPAEGESPRAHERAVRAKALDLLRGLLPAASLSHVGVFASAQTIERLILHLRAHLLPEARGCGELMLAAMQTAAPSFVTRVERRERGGEWVSFLERRGAAQADVARRLGLDRDPAERPSGVRLLRVEGSEELLLASLLFEGSRVGEGTIVERVAELSIEQRSELVAELVGRRKNRRHLPGRGFEALRYRFEIVSDYGAFRDLQRHRMLTAQWQTLGPHLGAEVPEELRAAGLADEFEAAIERSHEAWQALRDEGHELEAPYALCLAFRIRYVLDLNAREAIHLIELRSGREGHAGYRAIAHRMHELIAEVHPGVAAAMSHVQAGEEPRLERILAESRLEHRRIGGGQADG
jgi:thymidylate synthase ThyX